MIDIIFRFGSEHVLVRVLKEKILFQLRQTGSQMATIDNIKLNRSGVVKEYPDLKNNDNWRKEAINRFKEHIKKLKTERQRANYIIDDLTKFGYVPLYEQVSGFRVKKL